MPDNRSNQRNDNARNDNDAFGGSSRSGRGGSWSNRDDDDMLNRNAGSGRSRSGYDSELNDRMERGGSHTGAYGDEQSRSGDRYRSTGSRDSRYRDDSDRDMGADSWGGGADRDTGRDRYNRQERYNAGGSYNERDNEREEERNDYYGNRSMNAGERSISANDRSLRGRTSNRDDFNADSDWSRGRSGSEGMRNAGGPQRAQQSGGLYGDRYSGREGGSNQFSEWRNGPSDTGSSARSGRDSNQQWGTGSADMQRGQHAGRGPKGYRRDDARICEDVNEALTRDGELDASEIEVSVSGGEVTLTGTVENRDAKRHAEDIAERISGVSEVTNQIRVSRSGANSYSRTDSDSDRMSGRSSSDRSSSMKGNHDSEHDADKKGANKSGARDGTSTADGAMSAQGTGPSGAANTSTANTNPVPKSIPSTPGTSSHKTGDKGAQ